MKQYKTTFILDTRNYNESVDSLINKLQSIIQSIGGAVKKIVNLGVKDFVRVTSKKFPQGIYVEILIEAKPDFPSTLNEKLKLDKRFYRILFETV